jgi:hypothetical protein
MSVWGDHFGQARAIKMLNSGMCPPSQEATALPIVQAASEAWYIEVVPTPHGSIGLHMKIGADLNKPDATGYIKITAGGALTSAQLKDRDGLRRLESGTHHSWPKPVPAKRDWPKAVAEWVAARTAEVPAEVVTQWQISKLTTAAESALKSAERYQELADRERARGQALLDRIAALETGVTPDHP